MVGALVPMESQCPRWDDRILGSACTSRPSPTAFRGLRGKVKPKAVFSPPKDLPLRKLETSRAHMNVGTWGAKVLGGAASGLACKFHSAGWHNPTRAAYS